MYKLDSVFNMFSMAVGTANLQAVDTRQYLNKSLRCFSMF